MVIRNQEPKATAETIIRKKRSDSTPFREELLDELLANYSRPEDLTGPDGVLKQLTKALVERAMNDEPHRARVRELAEPFKKYAEYESLQMRSSLYKRHRDAEIDFRVVASVLATRLQRVSLRVRRLSLGPTLRLLFHGPEVSKTEVERWR